MSSRRTGFTTGTCASAAAKAAAMILCGAQNVDAVAVALPNGSTVTLPLTNKGKEPHVAWAAVRKDAGDDPDVTDGCLVQASARWSRSDGITLRAGDGVGVVTKPGLALAPGEPAINPVPRSMIIQAVREVTHRGVEITISIPGGRELAKKTFNPRLGIEGGLSILGTSGIVRPFSHQALRDALVCALNVAVACNVRRPIFTPGRIGEKAARKLFRTTPDQIVEVSNEWGFMLDRAAASDFESLLVIGHPGKLAKIIAGSWDTHSSRSSSAVPTVLTMAEHISGHASAESLTVEGVFRSLDPIRRKRLACVLAAGIRQKISERISYRFDVAVALVDLKGVLLGKDGDTHPWE